MLLVFEGWNSIYKKLIFIIVILFDISTHVLYKDVGNRLKFLLCREKPSSKFLSPINTRAKRWWLPFETYWCSMHIWMLWFLLSLGIYSSDSVLVKANLLKVCYLDLLFKTLISSICSVTLHKQEKYFCYYVVNKW